MKRHCPRIVLLGVLVASLGLAQARGQAKMDEPELQLDGAAQLMLIRNTLTLLNHANLSGNYTVLRDMTTANFRQRNTAADLAGTFAGLRQQKLDLSPILVTQPRLSQSPEIVDGRLQMVGEFPTRPQSVQFALAFAQVGGGWMVDEISVRIAPVVASPNAASQNTAASKPKPQAARIADQSRPQSSSKTAKSR